MRKALVAAAMGLAGFAAGPVQAMEIAPLSVPGSNVTLVAGGCGIGFHRGPYGGCRPNGYGYGGYGVVGAHPYGWHGGAYGWHGGGYHYGWHGGGYHYGPHGGGYHYHY